MFENSSIMILKAGTRVDEVLRLDVDAETQEAIRETLLHALGELRNGKTKVNFDGSYKPNEDEFLTINNFRLSDEIKDAIRNPLGVHGFVKEDGEFPEIKAIFMGERIEEGGTEKFNVVFQRFRKEQYISTKWYNLFFDNNTFFQEKRYGISIADGVDCYYTDEELHFVSFYFARQVFNLNEYYRSATDSEVADFAESTKLYLEDSESFIGMANTWIRRKIAIINDSKVLIDFSAAEIRKRAKDIGIAIEVKDKKVVIPNDKEQVKVILGFLDEEAYQGAFSKKTYLANSKRMVR